MSGAVQFAERPQGDVLVLFDVDETLTPARRGASLEVLEMLKALRKRVVIGYVGGSDISKQIEQLGVHGGDIFKDFDYCFPENGLTAYKLGKPLASANFIQHLGEEKYKEMVKVILHYIADLDIPVKRGTFIEFRNGMINVSPIGRNASIAERHAFNAYDQLHHVRRDFVKMLQEKFASYNLTYSVGGEISFDVFPKGWDKTYCLRHVESEGFKEIHFFGDKTHLGGNDYEIFEDDRTIGHAITSPEHTMQVVKELFLKN